MISRRKRTYLLLFMLLLLILPGCSVLKTALYHDYEIKKYDNVNDDKEYIVVFHGVYGKLEDMNIIAEALSNEGYNVISIQYPTNTDSVEEITEKYIKPALDNIDKERKVNFIVHSMGSGVLRYYLKNNEVKNLGKVVFISPPSHGSALSDNPVSSMLKEPLGKAVSQFSMKKESFVNELGDPDYPCYVMIGNKSNNPVYSAMIPGKDDEMVPLNGSKLDTCDYKIIDKTTHTSILKDDRTISEIKKYLNN